MRIDPEKLVSPEFPGAGAVAVAEAFNEIERRPPSAVKLIDAGVPVLVARLIVEELSAMCRLEMAGRFDAAGRLQHILTPPGKAPPANYQAMLAAGNSIDPAEINWGYGHGDQSALSA